jgi:Tol biopolymer transport system component
LHEENGDLNADICVTDVEGGFTRRLTTEASNEDTPSWSRDGEWIYSASNRSGELQIWKMPAEGGSPVQVTKNGGTCPLESEDGRFIYYADKQDDPSIWRLPLEGGESLLTLDAGEVLRYRYWTLWKENIVYRHRASNAIKLFDMETRQFRTLTTLPPEQSCMPFGVSVSPDGRWALIAIWDPETSDIVLVEGIS